MANLLGTLITGNLRTTQGYGTSDSTRILYPSGGSFVTTTSVITGAIRIKMPVFGSGMMMTCTVKVYEYSTNKSFTITFGGHRDSANWYNEFCYIDGGTTRTNLTVRFGIDDGVNCVWIGETSSSWSYPQVFVTDAQLGYVGYSTSWLSGWAVDFVTAFGSVARTQIAYAKITTANIGSQSVSYASTSGTFSTDWTNYKGVTDNAVAGQLMWKNYGNNHTIFDASNSTSPTGSAVNNTNSAIAWTGTYPTLMGWNGVQTYGVRVDSARVADYATSAGSAPNASNLNASYGVTAGAGNGLKFWGGDDTYKISMGNSNEYHYGPVTDYSIKTVIDSVGATRGFTWGVNGGTPIAALNVGNGNFQVAGTIANGSIWINNGANYNNYNENIRLFDAPNGVSVIAFSASGTEGSPKTSLLGYSDRLETRVSDTWEQRIYAGYVEARGSFRAPIFYDSDDTTYYVDPNGTSNLNTWTWQTSARIGRPYYWTNRLSKNAAQGYQTGTNGWGTDEGTWDTAWKGGFSGWDIWGTSTGHPQGGGYIHAQGIISGVHHTNSDASDSYGWMMVGAHNATDNRYWLRGRWSNSVSGWVEMITTGNIGSQSVNYAASAGSASSVIWANVSGKPSLDYQQEYTFTAPASTDGSGYSWVRITMGGFNAGSDFVRFSIARAIFWNGSLPYGGPSMDVVAYSREWHGGQEGAVITYAQHGSEPGSGWITNAGPRDLAGGGYWFYMRIWGGVDYAMRVYRGSGQIGTSWESTSDPGSVFALRVGVNNIGSTDTGFNTTGPIYGSTLYNGTNAVIHAGNIASQSVSYADSAGVVGTADYAVTAGELTSMDISQFSNNSGYITSVGNITKLWAESHPTDYYVRANWTGSYWQLTSNHSSPVQVGYADSAGNSNTTSQIAFTDFKANFPSGAGGGHSFGANHYSMGLDSGNGGWSGPHYRDLIIGYHTGVRIGANYSGIRFYGDSPTTDANNDGNGDSGESLLMTIGGYVGTANQTDVVVNNNLFANVSMRAPIFYDSADTTYYVDPNGNSRIEKLNISAGQVNAANNAGGRLRISSYTNGESVINGNTHNIVLGPYSTRTGLGLYYAGIAINGLMNYTGVTSYDVSPHIWIGGYYRDTPGSERSDFVVAIKSGTGTTGAGSDLPQPRFRVDYEGIASATGSFRAPIFYDSANTTYYGDFAGISSMYGVAIRGDLSSTDTSNQIFFWGNGNSTTSAIGFKANGGNFTNPTGFGDGYNTYLTMDTPGRGWVFREGTGGTNFGAAYTSGWILNNGVWQANASMRAPIFYDSNDTTYYGDFASTSVMKEIRLGTSTNNGTISGGGDWGIRFENDNGYIQFGPANSSWAHIYSGMSFYFNQELYVNGTQVVKNSGTWGISVTGDAGSVGGVDSSRIVFGDNERKTTRLGDMNTYNQYSGFFYENNPTNGPFADWTNWINVMGALWASNYGFQLAHQFHGDAFAVRRVTNGIFYSWRRILDSENFTTWAQEKENQRLSTSSSVTFADIYADNWFRNNNVNEGVYNQATGTHFYSHSAEGWTVTGSGGTIQLQFRSNHQSTLRGYVYADTSNNIGFLNNVGSWSLRCDSSGNVTATGDVTAYSDARLKTDVNTIEGALEKVLQMRGVTYVRTDNNDTKEKVGVIAQEIQQVLPQVVQENTDGYLTVSYGNIVSVLIEAIKEQQAQIYELKAKLDGLTK